MEPAPFRSDIADGPADGQAWWRTTGDGVRIRVGLYNRDAPNGTVFLFPGRTEYIEKYGRAASHLATHGYGTLVIDWRGQGLADRLLPDTMTGHVHNFSDYQLDVAEMVAVASELDLPKPWHLLAHSMGGCIGLRALYLGLPVNAAAFSGPMWGVRINDILRPVAWSLSWGSRYVGMDHLYAPSTYGAPYVLNEPFETNKLTHDRDMYQYMIDQTLACPELGLGGPSLRWLHEALKETRELSRLPSPDLPCMNVTGTEEDIVCVPRIRDRMARWPGSRMTWVEGKKHEVLMEDAATQTDLFSEIAAFYGEYATPMRTASLEARVASAAPAH